MFAARQPVLWIGTSGKGVSSGMLDLKRLYRRLVSTPGIVPRLLRQSDAGVVFMMHRFTDPALGNGYGHDVSTIRAILGYLRKKQFELVSLSELFERGASGRRLNGAIAFTIDDGYRDHASIAAPLFAEFDCPVTTFLTTGFLDRSIWFWWDQIEYVFHTTRCNSVEISLNDAAAAPPMKFTWTTPTERDAAQWDFRQACRTLPDDQKPAAIARLAAGADVEVPTSVPLQYSPMSWDDAREAERHGMTFGPHTVTHPILARASNAQSRFEIEESWRRLKTEVAAPVPVFCYPYGREEDYGKREIDVIGVAGMVGSVLGMGGYVTGADIRDPQNRYRIKRFAMPDNSTDLIQCVTGLERVKDRIRGQ
jgi:peptidoglycan/xylan/chitin deacetylase (PgdA/CDA1 family)